MKFIILFILTIGLAFFYLNEKGNQTSTSLEATEVKTKEGPLNILIYTKTNGFRHKSIPEGVGAIRNMASSEGWRVFQTEDSLVFSDKNLADINVIVFLNTTLTVLGSQGKTAFKKYINNGGGFVGVHAASDTEYDWPWYHEFLGVHFKTHPAVQEARLKVNKSINHPSVAGLDDEWSVTDEWYYFTEPVRDHVTPLMWLDESTIEGIDPSGWDHPISWYHTFEGGRVFYTGLGHTLEMYSNKKYLAHLKSGISWAGGLIDVSSN